MANKTRAQIRAERMAAIELERKALEAEQVEYDKQVKAAAKVAGQARAQVVEQLYEAFGIEPVTRPRQNADGTVTEVSVDKTEEQRTELLMKRIETLMNERDELRKQVSSAHGESAWQYSAQRHSGVHSVAV